MEEILRKCLKNIKNVKLIISKKSDSETILVLAFKLQKWWYIKGGRAFEVFWTTEDITQEPDVL